LCYTFVSNKDLCYTFVSNKDLFDHVQQPGAHQS
jgi:hypothetical protein